MPSYEIPLTPDAQRFSVTLSGTQYQLTVQWRNSEQGGWVLDLADMKGQAIIQGIPLVTGVNLLEQYDHLGFTDALWVQTTADPDAVPTFENLGIGSHLYWYVE
ncbi:phage baseplate plug protein [Pseudomonas sp. NPDC098747]|uniref:phage baseplate plug family protein n=1 Tax=Pseudomonas sp. NPDC098747 TaxID=3364487 RepID=UPI00383B5D50